MDYTTIADLLVEYIHQQRRFKHLLIENVTKQGNGLPYQLITFIYDNTDVNIKVYNQNFIVFKVNGHPKTVNDTIKQARKTIDSL